MTCVLKGIVRTLQDGTLLDGPLTGKVFAPLSYASIGPPGADGEDGADGADGAPGSLILTGSGAPSSGAGIIGDLYIDVASSNQSYYRKNGVSTWLFIADLKGLQGVPGSDGADGLDGIDGADGAPGLDGDDGAPGATWFRTAGVPSSGLGANNDFAIDTDSSLFNVYFKMGGSWNLIGNLKELTGPAGGELTGTFPNPALSTAIKTFLLARANHTGVQLASTISDFTTAAQSAAVQNDLSSSAVKAPAADAVNTALAGKMTDPMTTNGDLITRAAGVPARLGIGAPDAILRVVGGAPAWEEENLMQDIGDGSDGNLTLSGALTAPDILYYDTLTLNSIAALNPDGYIIYAKTLDLSNAPAGAISRNGNNGALSSSNSSAAGGAAFTARVLATNAAGGAGAAGVTNNGVQGAAGGAVTIGNGGNGGASGASGAGGSGLAAAAIAGGAVATTIHFGRFEYQFLRGATQVSGGAGGRGGNSGGGDGANSSRGGGGGGAGGAVLVLYVGEIITSPSTPAGAITAIGGIGGRQNNPPAAGNVGGAGGAGGGGGGYIYIAYVKKTGPVIADLIDASGGNGGNGSNGLGTGIGGNGGAGGNGGRIQLFNVTTGLGTLTVGAAGSAGTVGSGVTGGVGGQGGSCKVSL